MNNPALTQRVKALLICGLGLLFAIFIGTQIGAENYAELLLGTVIVIIACISFFSGRFFWVLTVASSFLGGTFPILGGQFTPFQILMAIGTGKFFLADIGLRRTKINVGTRIDALLIASFMAVLTWHGIHDRFGMRFLGSDVWGGRNYVNVFVGLTAYCVIQSIPINSKLWKSLPPAVLVVTAFDMSIAVITTIFPDSIYRIYPFYSAVSTSGIEEILTGTPDVTARVGAFGNFGFMVIIFILASVSVRKIFSPGNLLRLALLCASFLTVLYSGFRSAVTNVLIAGFVAGVRDLKWAILATLPFVAALLFGLSLMNSEVIALPKQVQRGLTFIPGKWDVDMASNAAASNDFRMKVWTLWWRQYFPQRPWLGRGFGFKSDWARTTTVPHGAYETQQMVETGNTHNGLFSSLDALGIVGTFFFVTWNLRLLGRTFRVSSPKQDPNGMVLRFLALYLAVRIISYWYGALSLGSFLPQEFAIAAVFLRLQNAASSERAASEPEAKAREHTRQELATA